VSASRALSIVGAAGLTALRAPVDYAASDMDGVHDMGGMHGFGPVVQPGGELAYHERWESRVLGIEVLVRIEGLGAGPGRPVIEEMEPARYLAASYYERWLFGAEQRLIRKGTIAAGDVDAMAGRLRAGEPVTARRDPGMVERALAELRARHPMRLPPPADARFEPGQRVRVKRMHPRGHTRCPRYARGVVGVVERVRGADRLPDRAVYGEPVVPEPVYSVVFGSQDLWGSSEEPPWSVRLDLWQSYLEPA
jgi:nitrile hydratase beta subunit